MHRVEPAELNERAIPVLAATLSESELLRWTRVDFTELSDPLSVPEPSLGALVELSSGQLAVLVYGRITKELVVEFPESANFRSELDAFFKEVPSIADRVRWCALRLNRVASDQKAAVGASNAVGGKGMADSKVTGRGASRAASKTFVSSSTGKASKSAAGSALSQTKAPKRATSSKAATSAPKVLRDGRPGRASKKAAGSALSQKPASKKSKKG